MLKSQKKARNWIVISGLTIITGLSATAAFGAEVTQKKGAAPKMKRKLSNVPQFELVQKKVVKGKTELVRVKEIPRLNLSEENRIKANVAAPAEIPQEKAFKNIKVAERPQVKEIFIDQFTLKKVQPVADPKPIVKINLDFKVPDAPTYPVVEAPAGLAISHPELQKIEEMPPVQMKLLQALIFLEVRKDYNMALALFAELLDEASIKTEAAFQLALTSKALGLYSEYKHRMMEVLNSGEKEWQKKAAAHLAMNAAEGDKDLVPYLDPKLEALKVELSKADQYQMNRGKYYMDKGELSKSFAAVDEILMDSHLYSDALFLKSLLLYKSNQVQEAIGIQQAVLKDVEEKRPKSEFKSIVALTLARLHFQAGQYKEAFNNYLKVEKTHVEWLQAMVEQAWSQILSEDYEGAAGNMFSLHTDFFKKAFTPESYVVRTVGYLNLCQYGDGARTVYDFKKKYTPVLKQMKDYGTNMKSNINYYDTIKTWAKNPDLHTVDGLPREFIFALTRHPSFILEQQMINSTEDQTNKINQISINLIQTERKALADQSDARNKLAGIKKKMDGTKDKSTYKADYDYQEKRLMAAKIKHYIAKKARNSIKDLREGGLKRLDGEKAKYRDLAGKAVKTRFFQMLKKLNDTLDQSDVLQYELYSGAGEHIRYQMAGGDINSKERAELKVEKGKDLNWDFRGEIWEDELGHYRSSLKNVCPPEEKLSSLDGNR